MYDSQTIHTLTSASISMSGGLHYNLNTTREHFKNDKSLEIYVQLTNFAFEQPENCRLHKSRAVMFGTVHTDQLTQTPSHLIAGLY